MLITSNFIRYDQDQQHLEAKDRSEWVEDDSLQRFVTDTIDHIDDQDRLGFFYPAETGENIGRPLYHTVMLLKVLVFAYAQVFEAPGKSTDSSNATLRFFALLQINTLISNHQHLSQ